jgi:hypothetical protein
MNVWADIQAIFNNREIALLLWIAVIVLAVLLSKLRKSLVPIIKILTKQIVSDYFFSNRSLLVRDNYSL